MTKVTTMTPLKKAQSERDDYAGKLGRLQTAVSVIYTSAGPDTTERIPDEPGTYYTVAAYGLRRADGGYIAVTFHAPNQAPIADFYSLEQYRDGFYRSPEFMAVYGRIQSTAFHLVNRSVAGAMRASGLLA